MDGGRGLRVDNGTAGRVERIERKSEGRARGRKSVGMNMIGWVEVRGEGVLIESDCLEGTQYSGRRRRGRRGTSGKIMAWRMIGVV